MRVFRRGQTFTISANTALPRAAQKFEVELARVVRENTNYTFQFVQFQALRPGIAARVLIVRMDQLMFAVRRADAQWKAFGREIHDKARRTPTEVDAAFEMIATQEPHYETQTRRAFVDRMTQLADAGSVSFGVMDGSDLAIIAGSREIDYEAQLESVVEVTMDVSVLAELVASSERALND